MMALMGVYQADRLAGAEWVSVQRFWVSLLGELKPALRLLCLQSAFSDCVCIFRLIFGFVETAFRPALFQIIGQGRGGQSECQGCGCGGLHESSEKVHGRLLAAGEWNEMDYWEPVAPAQ